jgi:arylsulfatase A-like enzyme
MVPPHNTYGGEFERHAPFPGERFAEPTYQTQYHAPEKYEVLYRDMTTERRKNVDGDFWPEALPGYFGAITGVDVQFGRLMQCLDETGVKDDTIVIYTSDHGDMMGSHNRRGKQIWYEESIGIPFIVRWPGHVAPKREDMLFSSVDVMPTLLGLLDIAVPKTVEGGNYSPALLGGEVLKPPSALLGFGSWRAVKTADATFVAHKYPQQDRVDMFFYDNLADPFQLTQVRDARNPSFDRLRDELARWLGKTGDPFMKLVPV